MIKSMTGFGRAEASDSDRKITIEMKSVNHRYFEPAMKMPKKLNIYEAGIRTILKKYINRGKVDIFVTYEDYSESKFCLKYNEELANEYMSIFNYMAEQFDIPNDITVSSLSHYPEVITMEEQSGDDDAVWHLLEKAVENACVQFVESRITEGEKLKADLLEKLDYMTGLVDEIENRSPGIIEEYRQRLEDKVAELLCDTPVDENRIATEVTIYADKICVDEETVRLRSHIESTKDELIEGGSVGRKLDFIAQEMNREANTILSKANDLETSNCAISLKTEIEKVREQIQNIE
ncbi:MAG TPA: YicC family protein [Lachnospiraceae bacterium]|nr:yicC protein [Butyrivibrio sp. CAG:318]HJI30982.1 YicC family protein [Lachnospiraceae bacterium]